MNRAVSSDGLDWERQPSPAIIKISDTRRHSRFSWVLPRKLLRLYPHYLHPDFRNRAREVKLPTGKWGQWLVQFHDKVIFPLWAKRYVSFNNSSVVQKPDGSYLMYFQAVTENGDLAIGRANSSNGITWESHQMNVLRGAIVTRELAWCSVFDGDPHLVMWQDWYDSHS